jgi:hypothetical protein
VGEVRKPWEPARRRRQLVLRVERRVPAWVVRRGVRPKVIHFPMRALLSESQRGGRGGESEVGRVGGDWVE